MVVINKNNLGYVILASFLAVFLISTSVFGQDFTQGFVTEDDLIRGSLVSRNEEEDGDRVHGATIENDDQLFGVVVRSDDSALTLTEDTSGVFVATSGRYEVLVSNIGGEIEIDDYIGVSAIEGVGMKANTSHELIVGKAVQAFVTSDQSMVISNTQATTEDGSVRNVALGRILVDVDVQKNPQLSAAAAPDFLLKFGESVAGKPVSPLRVYSALAILVITTGLGGNMLYAGIRSSIVAIGRNPLSRRSVMHGFMQVLITSVGIFVTGLFAIYLMLKI